MSLSNGQVWDALEQVRLRQVPWHKRSQLFAKLQAAGLVEPVEQKTLSMAWRPVLSVAMLTEAGKAELARLALCQSDEAWRGDLNDELLDAQ